MSHSPSDIDRTTLEELTEQDVEELSDAEVTSRIKLSVKRKFDAPAWILAFEYKHRNGRQADCLGLCTSSSRDFKLVGMEFKASRSDWRAEKRDPDKASPFVDLCDEWYVVAGRRGIVGEDELPRGWGLLELKPSGQLWELVEPDLADRQDAPLDRRFYAKFMRTAVGASSNFTTEDLREAKRRGYEEGKDAAVDRELDRQQRETKAKLDAIDGLEDRGVRVTNLYDANEDALDELAAAHQLLRRVDSDRFDSLANRLDRLTETFERDVATVEDALEDTREAVTTLQEAVPAADTQQGDESDV